MLCLQIGVAGVVYAAGLVWLFFSGGTLGKALCGAGTALLTVRVAPTAAATGEIALSAGKRLGQPSAREPVMKSTRNLVKPVRVRTSRMKKSMATTTFPMLDRNDFQPGVLPTKVNSICGLT